jgi:predicted amidohydrolase
LVVKTTSAGPYITKFRGLAKELGIAIAATLLEAVSNAEGDRLPPRNSVVLIDKHGSIVYTYAKVHPAWAGQPNNDPEGQLTNANSTHFDRFSSFFLFF